MSAFRPLLPDSGLYVAVTDGLVVSATDFLARASGELSLDHYTAVHQDGRRWLTVWDGDLQTAVQCENLPFGYVLNGKPVTILEILSDEPEDALARFPHATGLTA